MKRVAIPAAIASLLAALVSASPTAASAGCEQQVGLAWVEMTCASGAEGSSPPAATSHTGPIYTTTAPEVFSEAVGEVIAGVFTCQDLFGGAAEHPTPWYGELEDGVDIEFECSTAVASVDAEVQRVFTTLTWPASVVEMQPPDGTLVNLDTVFWTENVAPTSQTVRLLGQVITVEATPTSYLFVFDDSDPAPGQVAQLVSRAPGKPYPDQTIRHRYAQPGAVSPRVDTTYVGRYRLGQGAWRQITGTATVQGAPVPLQVREASPVLVQ